VFENFAIATAERIAAGLAQEFLLNKFTRRGGTESKALQYEKVSAQTAGDIATYPTLWFMPTYYSPRSAPTGPGCKARALA
jgi:hypothetical protein